MRGDMRHVRFGFAILAAIAGTAHAQLRYDFSEVTRLAAGAVLGQNVATPLPGFELLLMKDGTVVYDESFGRWNNGDVAACDSATKTLSGATIMSLTDRSASPFSLNTRLVQYVPAFSGAKAAITVRQCFSHASGLADSTAESDPTITLQQAAIQIAAAPLQYLPGTVFNYGGTSMQAAGAAAEVAAGQQWDAVFDQRIAGPLGLTHTRYVLTSPDNPRIAGGCESTASEFASFMEMLRAGGVHDGARILSVSAVTQMFTRQTPVNIPIAGSPTNSSDYGVGVWLDQRDTQGRLVGALAAGARGFSSWIDFDDGMVGCLATDLTSYQNVSGLLALLRDAAQRAARVGPLCAADFNRDGGIDGADVDAFFRAWERGGDNADVNEDGGTDFQDVDIFFQVWENGGC